MTRFCSCAGDARCVLARASEQGAAPKALVLTKEHKALFPAERKRIEKAGGVVTNGRLQGQLRICCVDATTTAEVSWLPVLFWNVSMLQHEHESSCLCLCLGPNCSHTLLSGHASLHKIMKKQTAHCSSA